MQTYRKHLMLVAIWAVAATAAAAPVHVGNEAEPAGGERVLQLTELWRVGGPDDEENLFGVIDKVAADEEGNLYFLDIQLTEVQVFDADGVYQRTLGQAGDGPGELRRASDVLLLPDGTVGLVQAFPGRIVKVDREGLPAGELRPGGDDPTAGGFFALRGAQVAAGRLVGSGARISRTETGRTARHFVASFDLEGRELTVYHAMTSEREMGSTVIRETDEYFPHGGWCALPDGRVVIAPERDAYLLRVVDPDGALERTFGRDYESWRRTDEEMAELQARAGGFGRRNRNRPDFVLEPTERDILQIQPGPDGGILVLPSRGTREQPEGVHSTWDVFDAEGRYAERLVVACDAVGTRDAIFFAGDDRVVIVKEHAEAMQAFRGSGGEDDGQDPVEAEPLEIVVYRIEP